MSAMPNELNTQQWIQLLSLLSLDVALPLYADMAVPVADKSQFQKTLRDAILDARRLREANRDQSPAIEAMFLPRVALADQKPFLNWAQGVFLGYHADQPDWSAWDIVFSQWAYSRRRDLDFLPKAEQDSFVAAYREKVSTDDIRRKSDEILISPLSDWDLEMFARHGYGSSWESSPFSTAEAVVRIERLKKFSGEVWKSLGHRERDQLLVRAQRLIGDLGVWMPGSLRSLAVLLSEQ